MALTIQVAGFTTSGIARAELTRAMYVALPLGRAATVGFGLPVDNAVDKTVDT